MTYLFLPIPMFPSHQLIPVTELNRDVSHDDDEEEDGGDDADRDEHEKEKGHTIPHSPLVQAYVSSH